MRMMRTRLNKTQKEFGNELIKRIAKAWNVTEEQAVRILNGPEYRDAWAWVNLDVYLRERIDDN